MNREPSRQEGLRTAAIRLNALRDRAKALVEQASTAHLTILASAIALLIGIGLGTQIASSRPSPAPGSIRSLTSVSGSIRSATDLDSARESASASDLAAVDGSPLAPDSAGLVLPGAESSRASMGDESGIGTDSSSEETSKPALSAAEYEAVAHSPTEFFEEPTPAAVDSLVAAVAINSLPVHAADNDESAERVSDSSKGYGQFRHYTDETDLMSLKIVTRGEIAEGETLGSSLRGHGISASTVHLIASEMREVIDFRKARPGDTYRLTQDARSQVTEFRYSQGPEDNFRLTWEGNGYSAEKQSAELHAQLARIAGVVDSSFYGAIVGLGEQSALASEFVRIFAWDIDFSRNVHPGDEFSILYERLYRRNGAGEDVYVRPGRILAGRYAGKVGPHTAIYFEEEDGGSYFRPDGSSIERAFLAAPLEFSRISSRFTYARRHPILNVTRPHPGIDYVAPHGTPVYAVASGVVEYRARAGASGNLIRIRHADGYTSHYAHLSRFERSLKVGDRVEQKQVIGYVGSSGLSTGPHVCFRVKKDGRYVDPMKISSPAGRPIERDRLDDFKHVRDQLLASLGPAPVNLVDEAL